MPKLLTIACLMMVLFQWGATADYSVVDTESGISILMDTVDLHEHKVMHELEEEDADRWQNTGSCLHYFPKRFTMVCQHLKGYLLPIEYPPERLA